MMIFKYPIELTGGVQTIKTPGFPNIVGFAVQGESLMLWAEVYPGAPDVEISVQIVGTGYEAPREMSHTGMVQHQGYVWHLYVGRCRQLN